MLQRMKQQSRKIKKNLNLPLEKRSWKTNASVLRDYSKYNPFP